MTITSEEQNVMLNEAKMASLIGEYISHFQPEDIVGDDIDLRFEVDGIDTGCDVSIVEQFGKTSAVIDKLLAHIDAQAARIAQLTIERDALRESEMGDGKHSNTRAAADIYFQLVEECNIPCGGSLVEYIDDMKERTEAVEKELSALRAKVKPAESYSDDADLSFQIDWYDDERNDGIQIAMWLKELRRRREMAAPVAVPSDCSHEWISSEGRTTSGWLCNRCGDYNGPAPVVVPNRKPIPDVYMATYHENIGWNACIDEVLRLNSGSEPAGAPEDLVMQIRRLVHALKNVKPDHSLVKSIPDYMRRRGYWKVTDCLRDDGSMSDE